MHVCECLPQGPLRPEPTPATAPLLSACPYPGQPPPGVHVPGSVPGCVLHTLRRPCISAVCPYDAAPVPCRRCTNHCKFSGLKRHGFIVLQFWRPDIQQASHWAVCVHFWRLRRRICLLAFSGIQSLPELLGAGPPSVSPASDGWSSLSHTTSLRHSLLPPSSASKDPCDGTGCIPDNLLRSAKRRPGSHLQPDFSLVTSGSMSTSSGD